MAAARSHEGTTRLGSPSLLGAATTSLLCYEAAISAIPFDLTAVTDFQIMKAKAILSSTCMQTGDFRGALTHLGDYITLSANNGFHLEANWPADLKETEKQERRRLVRCRPVFWHEHAAGLSYNSSGTHINTTRTCPRHSEARHVTEKPRRLFNTPPRCMKTKTSPRTA